MNTTEFLRRFNEGERDFSEVNFVQTDYSGINLSGQDLRGAIFTGAN